MEEETGVVTLEDVKLYMRMDLTYTVEDSLLSSLIKMAQNYCEKYTGLSFTQRELEVYTAKRCTELIGGPVDTIVSVKTIAGENQYFTQIGKQHPSIITSGECIISYTAGYTPENIPEQLKTAVKMMVATLFDNREAHGVIEKGSLIENPINVTTLLRPYSRSGGLFL